MTDGERFFLKTKTHPWVEVTEEEWIDRERQCGFRPKGGHPGRATGSFGAYGWRGMSTVPQNHDEFRTLYPDLPK